MAREIKGFKLDAPKGQVLREIQQSKSQRIRSQKQARQAQVSGERQESFIFGTLLNTTTYMIIFLLLLFGSSINVYQSDPEKYSWLDLNTDGEIIGFKEETYDITVSYNLDTPLDELNGYSLRQLFEDENQSDLTTYLPVGGSITHYDDFFTFSGTTGNTIQRVYNHGFTSLGSKIIFTIIDFKITSLTSTLYYFNDRYINTSNTVTSFTVGSYQRFYNYAVAPSWMSSTMSFQFVGDSTMQVNADFNNIVVIDLTTLGINQTEEEMIYWFSEYERLQDNRVESLKLLGAEVVSSWYTTTQTLQTIGEAIETIYKNTPIAWIIDLFADIGV